jgi:hypothetical protein
MEATFVANQEFGNALAGTALAFLGVVLLFLVILTLIFYVYLALCLMKIAKKTQTENAWFAWIPILNLVLMIQCANKSLGWLILFFIPFFNLIGLIIIWMAIAKKLGQPEWLGILMIVPVVNLILPGYLAFSKNAVAESLPPKPSTNPTNPV